VYDIVPGLSFPVIVTNFGAREVILRQRANVGYVELLTTGVVRVPHGAPPGAPPAPAFTPATAAEGVVAAVSSTRDDAASGRSLDPATAAGSGPAIPARPRDPGEGAAVPAAAPPASPPQVEDVDLPDVDPALHTRIRRMLDQHKAMWTGQAIGVIKATQHRIDLNAGVRSVRFAPSRAGHTAREAETAEVERQLEADVIEPTSSEWGFSVVLVPKKDGTLRFCVDYQLLNVVTKKLSYPLPHMDECIDSLGEATIFATLDCNAGYWQFAIAPEDREKTAFVCHETAYQYKRMPFGLTNALATFQRALDINLSGVKWQSCLIYLDDVIVYSETEEEHVGHVHRVLRLLRDAGVTHRLPKCRFFRKTVEYLGHEINPGRLGVMEAHTRALRGAHFTTTRTQVRSFVGTSSAGGAELRTDGGAIDGPHGVHGPCPSVPRHAIAAAGVRPAQGGAHDPAGPRTRAARAEVLPRRGRLRDASGRRPAARARLREAPAGRIYQPAAGNERAPLRGHGE